MPKERKAWTVAEASESVGVSQSALYRSIRQGSIRAVRIGGRVVIPSDELERLLAGGVQ